MIRMQTGINGELPEKTSWLHIIHYDHELFQKRKKNPCIQLHECTCEKTRIL